MHYAIFDLDSGEFRVIEKRDFNGLRHQALVVGSKTYCQENLVGASRCEACGHWILAANPAKDWPRVKDCNCPEKG